MSKSYEAGKEYAAELVSMGEVDAGTTVDISEMLNSTNEMPEEDYLSIERDGEDPDPRQYWTGYNDWMTENSDEAE